MVLLSRCCCFSLRSGVLLLGWAQAVMSVVSLCGVIVVDSSPSTSEIHKLLSISFRTLYILLGGSVIQTIAAIYLLYGTYRRKSAFVLEYVKLETLLHVASFLEFIIYSILEHSSFSEQEAWIFLGFLVLNYGLAAYYLLVAYSFYQVLTDEASTPLLQQDTETATA